MAGGNFFVWPGGSVWGFVVFAMLIFVRHVLNSYTRHGINKDGEVIFPMTPIARHDVGPRVCGSGGDTMEDRRKVFWSEQDLQHRLRRVEGQIRGIEAMVGRAAACQDILVQLAATQGALSKIVKIVEACRVAEGLTQEVAVGDPSGVRDVIARIIRE